MKHVIKTVVILILLAGLGGGGIYAGYWYLYKNRTDAVILQTAPVKRGDLLAVISATGTVEPEEVVDIGAQVAGQILSFGKDKNGKPIDYTSAVDEGTVLAQIDDSLYAADAAQAAATLAQAKSGVIRADADLGQMKAKLDQADRDWQRAQKLGPSEALAQASYDAYKSAYEVAKANLAVGEATIVQSKAAVTQAEAVLRRAQRNLDYCTIRSPVKGVIIDRRVNIGQTVVSSLNAPSLFLLAKDLTRMQVWVQVNEIDIGHIHPGQPVTFAVGAYPDQVFRGEVGKIRLNASMTQNVVMYVVEVVTDNSSGKLLPYLTADAKFEVTRRDNVLMVPTYALSWEPAPERIAPEFRGAAKGPGRRAGGGGGGAPGSGGGAVAGEPAAAAPRAKGEQSASGTVWVRDGQFVRPIRVRTGLSDGAMTEVSGGEIKEGMEVVVAEQRPEAPKGGTTNPFTPQFMRGNK
jgi:HlyD family secretion protein